jgi:hypothetical protein
MDIVSAPMRSARLLPILVLAMATACDGTTTGEKADAAPGSSDGAATATFTNDDGYPELTGSPAIASPSAAKGTEIKVTIPYDSDTRYVRLAIEDYKESKLLVQNWAQAVPAGGGSVEAIVSIPSTTTPTDTYYFTFDLCSSDACYDPFKRTTYERTLTGTTYTRVGYTSPPLTKSDGPRDSAIPIPTFTIQ